MALSSCEAECVGALYAACQAIWIEMLLEELKIMEPKKMKLFIDNKSAIDPANRPVLQGQSKHIGRTYYFLKDQVNKGKFELEHCQSERQLADILTNPLKKIRFDELKRSIGIRSHKNMNYEVLEDVLQCFRKVVFNIVALVEYNMCVEVCKQVFDIVEYCSL